MRGTLTAVSCALVLAGAAALYAESSTTLTVKPSEMRNGETKSITDDGRTITVKREGDTTQVTIEGAGETGHLTITREGDRIRIGRAAAEGRGFIIGPHRERIVIDGFPLDGLDRAPRFKERRGQTYFVCPKDQTTLRVPKENDGQSFRCPVDGTEMEKRKGHGFTFFFDDSSIEL